MHDWSDRIALVFSSGVAKRACAFGVIKTMEEMGYMVSSVAGISKGALVAGLYTAGKLDTNLTEYSLSKKRSSIEPLYYKRNIRSILTELRLSLWV